MTAPLSRKQRIEKLIQKLERKFPGQSPDTIDTKQSKELFRLIAQYGFSKRLLKEMVGANNLGVQRVKYPSKGMRKNIRATKARQRRR